MLKWTFIGLLLRFLIMPFSFHGNDIFYVYYTPFKCLQQGLWDPYRFSGVYFPGQYPYYPPLAFFLHVVFLFLFRPFLPNLHNLFSVYESRVNSISANTVQYASLFGNFDLFRTLFIFKLPYLIFDFLIAWFLFWVLKRDNRKAVLAYILWMLNPFLLHNYALGQFDVITAFFVMAAIYLIHRNRPVYACGLLSLGILTKTYPILLVPFAVFLLGKTFKEKLWLFFAVIIPLFLFITPFYLSSGSAIFKSLFFSDGGLHIVRLIIFICGYLMLFWRFCLSKKTNQDGIEPSILSFTSVLFLYFAFYIVTIRHFVIISPLLIYVSVKYKKFWIYAVILLVTLFESRTAGNTLQWGLFSALYPEFFSSLPILDSFFNLLLNVKYIHQAAHRLFVFSGLIIIIHICLISAGRHKPFLKPSLDNAKK